MEGKAKEGRTASTPPPGAPPASTALSSPLEAPSMPWYQGSKKPDWLNHWLMSLNSKSKEKTEGSSFSTTWLVPPITSSMLKQRMV